MPRPVLSKADFVRRYQLGEFGNASPTWDSLREMEDQGVLEFSPPWQLYHIRSRVAGGFTMYNVQAECLADYWERTLATQEGGFYISAMAPTHLTQIQGEVCRGLWGLELTYSLVPNKPMREALRLGSKAVRGIIAGSLLSTYLWPRDLDWLEYLLDAYPDHVVEFSNYSVSWGTVPGYSTVYWEVRRY